jgi:hypothetical protein
MTPPSPRQQRCTYGRWLLVGCNDKKRENINLVLLYHGEETLCDDVSIAEKRKFKEEY